MFEWLKDKLAGTPHHKAAEALRADLAPLEQLPGSKPRLAERLTRFVFTGEGESVLADLASMNSSQLAYTMDRKRGLAAVVKLMPEDPQVLLRLARVYDAAQQSGRGVVYIWPALTVPAFQGSLSWLGTFLIELSRRGQEKEPAFPVSLLSKMIEASGEDPLVLLRGPFFYEDAQGKGALTRWHSPPVACFQCLKNFPDLVLSSPDTIRPAFHQKEAGSRAHALRALSTLEIAPDPFAEEIASLAVSSSKEVRENAAAIISHHFSIFTDPLKHYAEKGNADERFHAVRLLGRFAGDSESEFLTQRLQSEKAARVSEAIQDALAKPTQAQTTSPKDEFNLPAIPEIPVFAPLDKSFLDELRSRLQEAENAVALQHNKLQLKVQGAKRRPVPAEAADRLFEALQNFVVTDRDLSNLFTASGGVENTLLHHYPVPAQFKLIHVVRWCLLLSGVPVDQTGRIDRWELSWRWSHALVSFTKAQKKPIDLRELAAVFKTIGLDDRSIGRAVLITDRYMTSPVLGKEPGVTWPYFAERLDLLEEALGLRHAESDGHYYSEQAERQNLFRVLKSFPSCPTQLSASVWDIALGNSKIERRLAQECLENFPNKEQKIIAALASRQQDVRLAAAQWLGAIDCKDAIPALRTALAKEKSDVVRDELIRSLELLGVPLEELLDLDQLDQDAEKGLKKGIPNDLDWFPFSQLPPVTWADSGKPVSAAIIQWFILQSYKLKNAETNPTLRRYCSLFRQQDRERLGMFILDAWIAQDTKPKYTAEQAAEEARRGAQQSVQLAKQYPQYYVDFDEERTYQTLFNHFVSLPGGSQTGTKGILAVAGACCGSEAAPVVHRYVKQWYGYRAAQCKALLQVLAWIEHPSATQVVLSVANRFRTKGIQEEALRLCQLLAERKGWTMDELADRTIPTAGFDEVGKMELDFGTRKFTATLSEEMAITLTNQSGKVITSLPDANQSDDAEKVKQSKAALSSARKELKTILSMQKDRLYEAMCTQRTWRFEDWDTYLRQHPIAGRYCQRLVWVAYDGEKIVDSFRPLADGTLTSHQDDEVKITLETGIRLGHDETLPPDDRTAWLQHFSDYEVEPLFQQFGKQQFSLPDDMKEATEITDFLGHLVMAFSLRNRLTKLGYTRSAAQDGGWFYEYHKTFLQLGIQAIIEFTGNPLPESNRKVALKRLYFARKLNPEFMGEELSLGELPRVLLSECWNDIRMAAAEGPGFAADWEKQAEF
jgi:Domain of unknown function (DUF4132)/HEAT repeats